jgi:hypothetical protein
MRPTDEDDPQAGSADDSLADGLEPTTEGGFSSSTDPYGDTYDEDDDYGDDDYDEDDDDGYDEDDSYGDDGADEGDTYGDGDATTWPGGEGDDDTTALDEDEDGGLDPGVPEGGGLDPVAHDADPLEGIGYILDEIGDALFGEDDDEAAASLFDTDPADATTDTDLDLTGDGVVDRADLHEARSVFDFHVSETDHHPHPDDGGLFEG